MDVNTEKEFSEFYLKYSKSLKSYIYKIIHDIEKAEDLMHDAFIRFYSHSDDLDTKSIRTKNYIYTIARNLSYDFLTKRQMEEEKYMTVHFEEAVLSDGFYRDLDSSIINGEIISTIHDTIESFSGKKKTIAIERIFHKGKLTELSKKFRTTSYMIKKIEEEVFDEIRNNLLHAHPGFEFDPDSE